LQIAESRTHLLDENRTIIFSDFDRRGRDARKGDSRRCSSDGSPESAGV